MTEMGNEWCTGTRLGMDGRCPVEVHVLLNHAEPPVFFFLLLHFTSLTYPETPLITRHTSDGQRLTIPL